MRMPTANRRRQGSTVRMGTALAIPGVLQGLGANPQEVLAEAGVDLTLFDDAEKRISVAARNRIIQHCAIRTGCPHFGLLLGQRNGLHSFGLLGLLVKYSPDVENGAGEPRALREGSRPRRIGQSGDGRQTGRYSPGRSMSRGWKVPIRSGTPRSRLFKTSCRTLRSRLDAHRSLVRTPPTGECRSFPRLLSIPLRFDAEQFALLFPTEYLKRRLPSSMTSRRRLLQSQIDVARGASPRRLSGTGARRAADGALTGQAKADQVAASSICTAGL